VTSASARGRARACSQDRSPARPRNRPHAGGRHRQIGQILDIRDGGEPPCEHVGQLIDHRLNEVEQRIAELEQTRTHLRELARRTSELDPADCGGYCHIIQAPIDQSDLATSNAAVTPPSGLA
jgi:hypothetical protein